MISFFTKTTVAQTHFAVLHADVHLFPAITNTDKMLHHGMFVAEIVLLEWVYTLCLEYSRHIAQMSIADAHAPAAPQNISFRGTNSLTYANVTVFRASFSTSCLACPLSNASLYQRFIQYAREMAEAMQNAPKLILRVVRTRSGPGRTQPISCRQRRLSRSTHTTMRWRLAM